MKGDCNLNLDRMIKQLSIIALATLISGISFGQTPAERVIFVAEIEYFDNQNFGEALPLYQKVEELAGPDEDALPYAKTKIASCLYFMYQNAKVHGLQKRATEYAEELIDYIASNKNYIQEEEVLEKQYLAMQHLIVHYNKVNQPDEARKHQEQLYIAYYRNELPKAIEDAYMMDEFRCEGKLVRVYESFDQVHQKEGLAKFDKHVFEIFETGDITKEKLYTIQTERLMSSGQSSSNDFVLTKRQGFGIYASSQPFWQHTFKAPTDYRAVKEAVTNVMADLASMENEQPFAENR